MKSCEGEPPLAPTAATAEKLESFLAEPANGTKDRKRKSGVKDFSATLKNGKQDLASRPTEAGECLLNVSEAARFLAVSVSTLYGWVWQRRISFVKLGRAVRFDMTDLKRFVEQNRIHARTARKF
jgi:excisionase family DNA binding protein